MNISPYLRVCSHQQLKFINYFLQFCFLGDSICYDFFIGTTKFGLWLDNFDS